MISDEKIAELWKAYLYAAKYPNADAGFEFASFAAGCRTGRDAGLEEALTAIAQLDFGDESHASEIAGFISDEITKLKGGA